MALNGDNLGDEMRVAVTAEDPADRTAMFRALGNAVIDHFKNNAEITIDDPSGLVDNQGNPPASSHTGTATGGIT